MGIAAHHRSVTSPLACYRPLAEPEAGRTIAVHAVAEFLRANAPEALATS